MKAGSAKLNKKKSKKSKDPEEAPEAEGENPEAGEFFLKIIWCHKKFDATKNLNLVFWYKNWKSVHALK